MLPGPGVLYALKVIAPSTHATGDIPAGAVFLFSFSQGSQCSSWKHTFYECERSPSNSVV